MLRFDVGLETCNRSGNLIAVHVIISAKSMASSGEDPRASFNPVSAASS